MASVVDEGISRETEHPTGLFATHRDAERRDRGVLIIAPLGFGIHAAVIGAVVLGSLFTAENRFAPAFTRAVLHFAPPPPPPLLKGSPEAAASDAAARPVVTTRSSPERVTFTAGIPEAILAPAFELGPGFDDGVVDGELNGMQGGVPTGVVGGVPGGLVGGVVGGSGTELPRFPKPDVGPRALERPQPRYTEEAIRANVTGSVKLRVLIDERGRVQVLQILSSVPELDHEAIQTVESSWRFSPATKNGRPVKTLADLIVRFNLH